jgi:hypothetical protein
MSELKPCPFCGSSEIRSFDISCRNMDSSPNWMVECQDCGGEYLDVYREDAENGWNERIKEANDGSDS